MFGSEKNNKEEIGRIWARLVKLEDAKDSIDERLDVLDEKTKTASEQKEEIRSALRSATTHLSHIVKKKESIVQFQEDVRIAKEDVEQTKKYIDETNDVVQSTRDATQVALNQVNEFESEAQEQISSIASKIDFISDKLDDNTDLASRLELAQEQVIGIEEASNKIKQTAKTITSLYQQMNSLKNEIFGYEAESDTGETEEISGLKDTLEETYEDLSSKLELIEKELNQLDEDTKEEHKKILQNSEQSVSDFLTNCSTKFDDTYKEIKSLLPTALTAGLSSAYEEKVRDEETHLANHRNTFSRSITGLVVVSLIPFAVNLYLFFGLGRDVVNVISDTPKMLLSILPIYIPILWIAYSSNKKANLSKRLIEEYTHKGVLSKTYEGLSKQISSLQNDNESDELRVKLLFNLLHVNSENPGKLISDYKTTDHPLIDALEKSVKLADAIDRLKNIPGFSKLATKLDNQRTELVATTDKKSSDAIERTVEEERINSYKNTGDNEINHQEYEKKAT